VSMTRSALRVVVAELIGTFAVIAAALLRGSLGTVRGEPAEQAA